MVEVDVFWAYGFGASLALGAGRQLAKKAKPFESRYFVWTVLFLALCWAPTGMLLLIRHPSWETMQAADTLIDRGSTDDAREVLSRASLIAPDLNEVREKLDRIREMGIASRALNAAYRPAMKKNAPPIMAAL